MQPFSSPRNVLTGFKERIDTIVSQGDRLYIGTSTGNLHIYAVDDAPENGEEVVTLVEVKKGITRRAIDQMGFIKDINSLVILSEMSVILYPIPGFSPPTPLVDAKAVFSFAVRSQVKHVENPSASGFGTAKTIPTLITELIVGCRKRVVIYTWKDGESQEVKEAPLTHSPRTIAFLDEDTLCFAYPSSEYAMFSISSMTATDTQIPLPITAAPGAFSGLGGYMTLGLGAKVKPCLAKISDSEVLVVKDSDGIFLGKDGKASRTSSIDWPAPPEEIFYMNPYIISILPPEADILTIQIRSSLSPSSVQAIPFQATHPRLLTSSSTNGLMYVVLTPTDKTVATNDGSSIVQISMKSWSEQIDVLVLEGSYSDALALLDILDSAILPDKETRQSKIRGLNAVSLFRKGQFDEAIDTFISLDVNPAKVVALYPEQVVGRLATPAEEWIPLLGGPKNVPGAEIAKSKDSPDSGFNPNVNKSPPQDATDNMSILSGTGALRGRFKTGLGALMASTAIKEDDSASIHSNSSLTRTRTRTSSAQGKDVHDNLNRSVETLVRYLSDRRPKVDAALLAMGITPANQSHGMISLAEAPIEELFALPSSPLSSLTPEQLIRYAQIIYTVLFKSYLIIRPGLLGSLCRVPNWCEVSEVETELRARSKFTELKDLYNGKKMHRQALELLKQLSEKEDDPKDKLLPSIWYLQKLGPEYLDQIFATTRWIFAEDPNMAFEIFTSEEVELPRNLVANFLEDLDSHICAKYLEYLISERHDEQRAFHDRLAELYLKMTLEARKEGNWADWAEQHKKLLNFIDSNQIFSINRMYDQLASQDLYEARAILLGRMGRHDKALELYVYRTQDFVKAETYCKRYYKAGTDTANIFLTLLRIYLRPTSKTVTDLLHPALDLISRHSPRIDAIEALQLLPPLVTTQDLQMFLIESLRAPIFGTRVHRQIGKACSDQISRKLMLLESQRVKVTDSRICPQCHKRIGNSVIVVHAPRGEVTHYNCRDAFALKLKQSRLLS